MADDEEVVLVAMNPGQRQAFEEWIVAFDCQIARMPPTHNEVLNGALPVYLIVPTVEGFHRG